MKIGKFLIIIGLILSFLGTIALGRGLVLNHKQIDQLSGTYFGHNEFLKESLTSNRNWAVIGFVLLIIGLLLQLLGTVKIQ